MSARSPISITLLYSTGKYDIANSALINRFSTWMPQQILFTFDPKPHFDLVQKNFLSRVGEINFSSNNFSTNVAPRTQILLLHLSCWCWIKFLWSFTISWQCVLLKNVWKTLAILSALTDGIRFDLISFVYWMIFFTLLCGSSKFWFFPLIVL